MRQGDKRGAEVDFFDFTYDGIISQNYLHDGLGQLTDGEEGDTNFRLDTQNLGIKGYEWVGWKNDTLIDPGPVEILFKFNTFRNFSSVMLHCNNYYTKDNRVFKTAVIYYSIGGKYFKQKKDKFYFIRDTVVEYARNVYIKLDNIIARYIKLQLYFDSKWVLISEVQFESSKYFLLMSYPCLISDIYYVYISVNITNVNINKLYKVPLPLNNFKCKIYDFCKRGDCFKEINIL